MITNFAQKLDNFLLLLALYCTVNLCAVTGNAKSELTALGQEPQWHQLNQYQYTISHNDFAQLISKVYRAKNANFEPYIYIFQTHALILTNKDSGLHYRLNFKQKNSASKTLARYWKAAWSLPKLSARAIEKQRILQGVHIAIDPGHIGGDFAEIEERFFAISNFKVPVKEGDMTLLVAKKIRQNLRQHGAKLTLIRKKLYPLTKNRPEDFRQVAIDHIAKNKIKPKDKQTYEIYSTKAL